MNFILCIARLSNNNKLLYMLLILRRKAFNLLSDLPSVEENEVDESTYFCNSALPDVEHDVSEMGPPQSESTKGLMPAVVHFS